MFKKLMDKKKTPPIPVRLSTELYPHVLAYAAFFEIGKSEAIRRLVKEGLMKSVYIELLKQWNEKRLRSPSPIYCEKCNSDYMPKFYYIDGNILNDALSNRVLLCENCRMKLNTAIFNPEEKFASWFFFSK